MNNAACADSRIQRGFQGVMHGATLPDLIQMECLGMTTRAVRVDRAGQSGRIFFAGGQVVHAEIGDLRGEAALTELIAWPDGSFSIEEGVRPYEETITRQWQSLLIAAAHLHDEMKGAAPTTHSSSAALTMSNLNDTALKEVLNDAEVQNAACFTDDGALLDGKGDGQEELHVTFSYVVQLARLIGESLGAENLSEIQITGADYRSLCVVHEHETVALITTAKGNLAALAKKLS